MKNYEITISLSDGTTQVIPVYGVLSNRYAIGTALNSLLDSRFDDAITGLSVTKIEEVKNG